MKRIIIGFAGVILVLSLAACAPTPQQPTAAQSMPSAEATTGGASDKVPDPNAEPMDIISVYCPNKDGKGLYQSMDAVPQLTAQSLVDKLIEGGILEKGTKALKFDTADGIGTLDLNKVPTSGTTGENLILTAIGNTFTENFKLDKLKLLVNGKNYSSGHIKHGDKDYLEFNSDYKKM